MENNFLKVGKRVPNTSSHRMPVEVTDTLNRKTIDPSNILYQLEVNTNPSGTGDFVLYDAFFGDNMGQLMDEVKDILLSGRSIQITNTLKFLKP